MNKITSDAFNSDVKKQDIESDGITKIINKLFDTFMKKSTSAQLGSLVWEAAVVIFKQHKELERLKASGCDTK